MVRISVVGVRVVIVMSVLLLSGTTWAQQTSGIAGVVRDTSGAVLPGVTVEAASPALIEKVRTVVTDGEGRYNIVDLRPGTYTVTFTLTGFNTARREGVELPGGFSATVNAELRVGALEETVTVTGAAPLVDVQNVKRQAAATDELLATLPSGAKSFGSLAALVPGVTYQGGASASGSRGIFQMAQVGAASYHGRRGSFTKFDGMGVNSPHVGDGAVGYVPNAYVAEEMRVETGGVSAESNTAVLSFDMIPKEGGNQFSGLIYGHRTGDSLQSSNLNDTLQARGLATPTSVDYLWDLAGTLGGPIKQDRLWFFTANRGSGNKVFQPGNFFNKTQGGPLYTPDLDRPAFALEWLRANAVRLTWQVSAKNKLNFFGDNQRNCNCRNRQGNQAPETAANFKFDPQGLYQATWSSPLTNRVLLEGGGSLMVSSWSQSPFPETKPETEVHVTSVDLLTGYRYNNKSAFGAALGLKSVQRFSVSYITGSHAFKTGLYWENGLHYREQKNAGSLGYQFSGTVPAFVEQFAYPYREEYRGKASDLVLFAQDQWTANRLTLNLGLKFDYFNTYIPAQEAPAGAWVPARRFEAVHKVPEWKNINPRLGASYDLFGNGRTAVKGTLGRYNGRTGVGTYVTAGAANPFITSVNGVRRTWNDANRNYVPDCDLTNFLPNGECGQISDLNFGKQRPNATRLADEVLHGWSARDYFWNVSAEVQQQFGAGLSATVGYYRDSLANFREADNLEVGPGDFSPYCVTAPTAAANGLTLPGGGGYQVCGLYDVSPAKFGTVQNLVTKASHFGKWTDSSDFIALSFNGRLGRGIQLGGGIDTGRSVRDRCYVVDSPQQLLHCRAVSPFAGQTQGKVYGSIPLPADILVSGTLQNVSGPPILAMYTARNAEVVPTLGRNLAACGTRVVCTASTSGYPLPHFFPEAAGLVRTTGDGIPLIAPGSQYAPRVTTIDFRLSKIFRLPGRKRLQANLDIYNLMNAGGVFEHVNDFGPRWQRPTQIQDARLVQFGGQFNF